MAAMFKLLPPSFVLVLAGVAGSGKSTWARRHFPGVHVLSSDAMRRVLTDDEDHRECSRDAFAVLETLADLRLRYGRPVVIDATNLRRQARKPWLKLAKKHRVPAMIVWFDVPPELCVQRQSLRARKVPVHAIARQAQMLEALPGDILDEGWAAIGRVHTALGERRDGEMGFEVRRPWTPPRVMALGPTGVRIHHGKLDIIGDVHGCIEELDELLGALGWSASKGRWSHPDDRLLIFVGDLTDRGPNSVAVLHRVAELVEQRVAVLVLGNHDDKLMRYLLGRPVKASHGLETTVAEIEALTDTAREALRDRALALLERAPLWALADPEEDSDRPLPDRLVVAHAAWKPSIVSRSPDRQRSYCIYGPTTGKTRDGLPERLDWKIHYPKAAPHAVVGHTAFDGPVVERHNTTCIDTGCVFGARLTALRWPERETVAIEAKRVYYDKPLAVAPVLIKPEYRDVKEKKGSGNTDYNALRKDLEGVALGIGPDKRFDLRMDHLMAAIAEDTAALLNAIDQDPLLLKRKRTDDDRITLANAGQELFSPQTEHHLYAKGIVYRLEPEPALVSLPYLKMYNYGEREDTRTLSNTLAATDGVGVVFNEKLDGTMIQLFTLNGEVVLTTRGMIEGAVPPTGGGPSFGYLEAARAILKAKSPLTLEADAVGHRTLLFELIHPKARIVTDYGVRKAVVLTGAIDYSGAGPRYVPRAELVALAEALGCEIAEDLKMAGETLAERLEALETYLAGTDLEGAVITFEGEDRWGQQAVLLHRVKVKGADYIRIMRQMSYCTYDRTRRILETHPELTTWDALSAHLQSLGSDEVPEEVLASYRDHFETYMRYKAAVETFAAEVRDFFAAYTAPHPIPSREETPKRYGAWRKAFARFVTSKNKEMSWLLFAAADDRVTFDKLNTRFKGVLEQVETMATAWKTFADALEPFVLEE